VRRLAALAIATVALVLVAYGARAARDSGPPDARAAADPAVVAVAVTHGSAAADLATGFLVARGRVVTVAHVVAGGGAVAVRGGAGAPRAARVLRIDTARDLAVLAVAAAPRGAAAARTGTGAGPVRVLVLRGSRVRAVPARVRRHITARVADATGGPEVSRPALELGADVAVGDSGAPVVAADGRVVGVLFARSDRRPGTAYAVDGAALAALVRARGAG
jgi:S1-C subfamily serine protease